MFKHIATPPSPPQNITTYTASRANETYYNATKSAEMKRKKKNVKQLQ